MSVSEYFFGIILSLGMHLKFSLLLGRVAGFLYETEGGSLIVLKVTK